MPITNRKSKWHKEIGGDFGCVKIGRQWVWYDCLQCSRHDFPEEFSTPRWQGPPSQAIISAKAHRNYRRYPCHGPERHKEIWATKRIKEEVHRLINCLDNFIHEED